MIRVAAYHDGPVPMMMSRGEIVVPSQELPAYFIIDVLEHARHGFR